jgi:hypothetical protein
VATNTGEPGDVSDLEQEVDAIRDDLGELVGELDRRRHRATKPVLIGTAAVAATALAFTGLVMWRRHVASRTRHPALEFVRAIFARD